MTSQSKALVTRPSGGIELQPTMESYQRFAKMAIAAGLHLGKEQGSAAIAKACIKLQYGAELGLSPLQSMCGIYVVGGKPAMSAGLMVNLVTSSGKYSYRVTEHTTSTCTVVFRRTRMMASERGMVEQEEEEIGTSTFTMEDAKAAGIVGSNANYKKYPKNMLFARAFANGARWYCADALNGAAYTAEEIGAGLDEAAESLQLPEAVTFDDAPEPEPEPVQYATVDEQVSNDPPF